MAFFERSKMTLNYVGELTGLLSSDNSTHSHTDLHVVDQLIAERGHGLSKSLLWPVIRPILYRVLHYHEAIEMADEIVNLSARDCIECVSKRLQLNTKAIGLENIPLKGGFILVCNHPTGIADGIAIWDLLAPIRSDMAVFANRDAIRVNRNLSEIIIPVEWRDGYKTRDKSRETLRLTTQAIESKKAILLFPSGRIAHWHTGRLKERSWQTSAVVLARKYNLPIVPAHMAGRNSWLFYCLSKFSFELRDMTVFHEFLNKKGVPFNVIFGKAIEPDCLTGDVHTVTRRLQNFCTSTLTQDPLAHF